MSSFSEALAHEDDPLREHLSAVAKSSEQALIGVPNRAQRAAVLTSLLHDAGKATSWFQRYLHGKQGRSERTRHSLLGSVLAHRILSHTREEGAITPWTHWAVVTAIARHHGNFVEDLQTTLIGIRRQATNSQAVKDQLEDFDEDGFRQWLAGRLEDHDLDLSVPSLDPEDVLNSVSSFHPSFEDPFDDVTDGFDFLTAFGAFVGADKMHTAHPSWERESLGVPPEVVEKYKQDAFDPPKTDLNKRREEIFDEVQRTIESLGEEWIYTLTAPTGSGKTLTGLAAGLRLKQEKEEEHRTSRLVYCLPFTSVIDQNSEVYRQVLEAQGMDVDEQLLLTHHHLADPRYRKGEERIVDGSDLLVETWESEIIVTTFYQLLHTLFTSRNKNLKRFGALRDAVVVLDEVQAIPHRYWEDIRSVMKLCAERLGTTFLLMTATMPLIVTPDDGPELLPSHARRYEQLARTHLSVRGGDPLSIEELAAEVEKDVRDSQEPKRRILLVNRRRTAQRLYEHLRNLPVPTAMLSTDLTPLDRTRILDGLGDEFLLVSTQVIEAGVDISSDTLIRELAPLDSIIQSAGRCNRNFERDRGQVDVVELEEDGSSLATPPYSGFLVESTLEVLREFSRDGPIDESRFHEMAREYYRIIHERGSSQSVTELLAHGKVNLLDDPSEGFQLIETRPEQSHFIIQDHQDRKIWEDYIQIQNMPIRSREDFVEKRRRFNEIKRAFTERLINYPTRERPSEEVIPVEPENNAYDEEMGLSRNLAEAGYEFI